jgi:uncharacterized protein (DUF433 family)
MTANPAPESRLYLERPLYTIGEAARLLEIGQPKLRRWLEGATVRGVQYAPVIRETAMDTDEVTWAEFVEAGYLRGYRDQTSLHKLRKFISVAREAWSVKYPLAEIRPEVLRPEGKLLAELKSIEGQADFAPADSMLDVMSGELVMREPLKRYLETVEFDASGVVARMFPLGRTAHVAIDPQLTFGLPQVRGIRTETLAEEFATGVPREQLTADYRLSDSEIEEALRWEMRLIGKGKAA